MTFRIFGGKGYYQMSDAHDVWDAMHEHTDPYSPERVSGPGSASEFWAYAEYGVSQYWHVGLGVGLLADDFEVCWYEPDQYFPGTHGGPELQAYCRALELCATRSLVPTEGWFRPYARLGAGYAWSSIDGTGQDISFGGNASAPILQASVGVDLSKLSFFDLTVELGVRYLRFSTEGIDVEGAPVSGMDAELSAYLADGTLDFSGYFYRVGFTFRH